MMKKSIHASTGNTNKWSIVFVFLAFCSACSAGCLGPLYHEGPRAPAAAISARSTWVVFGDLMGPEKAIDGNFSTAAVSEVSGNNNTITIDLGKPCLFNMVVIEHGRNEFGFSRRVALLTSMDGQDFTHRHDAPGTRGVTILCVVRPILARYVRLQVIEPGRQQWTVAEIYLQ